MSFRVLPEGVTMYPGQTQVFVVANEPSPVIWGTDSLTINSDRTLDGYLNNAAVPLAVARSGICRIKWTFDAAMMPASGNTVDMRMTANSTSGTKTFVVKAGPASTVITDGTTTLTTITRTLASGDYYVIERAGQVFRAYINSDTVSSYTWDPGVALRYPGYCAITWGNMALTTASHITIPELIGDWGVDYEFSVLSGDWTCTDGTTAGGTFDDSSDVLRTTFTAGSKPGAFPLECIIAGQSTLQKATSLVTIAPLTITGVENEITLQPGEERKIQTNYDANGLKTTWTVVSGGGSFTNGVYTAATTPGTSVLRSTYGNQMAQITVTVPVTITSSVGIATATEDRLRVQAAVLGEAVTFTTNMTGSITWSADYGTSSGSGSSFVWTAPSTSNIDARITATNGTYTKTVIVPVLKKLPYDPNAPIEGDLSKTVVVSTAEDRSRYARIKDRNQQYFHNRTLTFLNRDVTELNTMGAFWDEHFPQRRFIYDDKLQSPVVRRVMYFDSNINFRGAANCAIEYSIRCKEA